MVGWHHQLDGLEFEEAPRTSEGQGSLSLVRLSNNFRSVKLELSVRHLNGDTD